MKLGLVFCLAGIATTVACTAPEAAGPEGSAQADLNRAARCTPDQQAEALARMLNAPIVPRKSIAGLDLFSGDGATIDALEATACSAKPLGEDETTGSAAWGTEEEVNVTYDKKTRIVNSWQVGPGYRGTLDFASRPAALADPTRPNPFGQHTYSIGVARQILRDGQAWELNWTKACGEGVTDCWNQQATELFDAMMYTFAPDQPSTQTDCIRETLCLGRLTEDTALFGVRPLGTYFAVFEKAAAGQPALSTPSFLYGFTKRPPVPPPPPSERHALAR